MKINKTLIAIFCMMFVFVLLPETIKAEDSLKAVCKTSSTNVYPGENIDVVVYLDNYDSQNIKDITTMQLFINLNSDYYTYVENSLKDLSDAKSNEQIYILKYASDKNQIQLQFSDLTKILSRNTKNLYIFKIKINDKLVSGSNFDIGPDVFSCVDGRAALIYTVPSEITKSSIHVVEKALADSSKVGYNPDNITNNAITSTVSNATNSTVSNATNSTAGSSNNTQNDNGTTNQNAAVVQDGTTSNKSSEVEASNDADTDIPSKNLTQASKLINVWSIAIIGLISMVIIGLIIYYVLNKRRKNSEK